MKHIWLILALSGLGLTLLPSILVFMGVIGQAENHRLMGVGLLLWLAGRGFYGTTTSGPGTR